MIRTTEDCLQLLFSNPECWVHLKYCLNVEKTVTDLMVTLDLLGIKYLVYPYFLSDMSQAQHICIGVTGQDFVCGLGPKIRELI